MAKKNLILEKPAILAAENSCPAPLQTGSGRRLFNLKTPAAACRLRPDRRL
jgi:hypothetical protein